MFPTGKSSNSLTRASKYFGASWLWKHQPQSEKKTPEILTPPCILIYFTHSELPGASSFHVFILFYF